MAKKEVVIDFDGFVYTLKQRGVKFNQTEFLRDSEFNTMQFYRWKHETPAIVEIMYWWIKESKISFPDAMKKLKHKSAPLDFILHLCNETGLTFFEVVKLK